MYTNCDEVFKMTIPAARIVVAKSLSKKYKMNQSEIANRLGTTQAAVNKYLNSRYSKKIAILESAMASRGLAKEAVATAYSAKGKKSVSQAIDRLASSGYMIKEALKIV